MRAEEHSALESMELNKSIKIKWDFTIKNKEFFFIVNHRLNSYFDPTTRLLSVFDFNKMEKNRHLKKMEMYEFFFHFFSIDGFWQMRREKKNRSNASRSILNSNRLSGQYLNAKNAIYVNFVFEKYILFLG